MKTKHGVALKYGRSEFKLSASDLQLISDALSVVSPDSRKAAKRASQLQSAFESLAEYAKSLKAVR